MLTSLSPIEHEGAKYVTPSILLFNVTLLNLPRIDRFRTGCCFFPAYELRIHCER